MSRSSKPKFSRRAALSMGLASLALPRMAAAASPREITWDDLIPPGVPYAEIIAEGELDEANDFWRPVFDENGEKLNELLDGAYVRIPGFVLPLETSSKGVLSFVLVPYAGACIHTPPPPPNQLIFVTTQIPWVSQGIFDPVWVEGEMRTHIQSTEVADTGYAMLAEWITPYEW